MDLNFTSTRKYWQEKKNWQNVSQTNSCWFASIKAIADPSEYSRSGVLSDNERSRKRCCWIRSVLHLSVNCTDTVLHWYSIALTSHCTEQIALTQYYTVARSQLHRVRSIASVLHWKSNLRLWQRWQQSPIWDGGRVAECTSGFFHSIQSKPIQVTTRLHWTK